MKKADPRLQLVVAMTVFGTLGLFVRNISVSSGELALYRAVLAALLIGVYLLVSRQKIAVELMDTQLVCDILRSRGSVTGEHNGISDAGGF